MNRHLETTIVLTVNDLNNNIDNLHKKDWNEFNQGATWGTVNFAFTVLKRMCFDMPEEQLNYIEECRKDNSKVDLAKIGINEMTI